MKEILEKLVTVIDYCSENKNNVTALIMIAENIPDIVSMIKSYDDSNLNQDVYSYLFNIFSSEKFIKGEFGIELGPDKRKEIAKIILDSKLKKE